MTAPAPQAEPAAPATGTTPNRRRLLLALLLALVLGATGFVWWATRHGYLVVGSVSCTDVGFRPPVPSYERLTADYHQSPYCARRIRGENWF